MHTVYSSHNGGVSWSDDAHYDLRSVLHLHPCKSLLLLLDGDYYDASTLLLPSSNKKRFRKSICRRAERAIRFGKMTKTTTTTTTTKSSCRTKGAFRSYQAKDDAAKRLVVWMTPSRQIPASINWTPRFSQNAVPKTIGYWRIANNNKETTPNLEMSTVLGNYQVPLMKSDKDVSKPAAGNPAEELQAFLSLNLETWPMMPQLNQSVEKGAELVHRTLMGPSSNQDKTKEEDSGDSPFLVVADADDDELPPNNDDLHDNMQVMVRELQPWFPVMPNDVCLGWNCHAGTITWRTVVRRISSDVVRYPAWKDAIVEDVKEMLAQDDITIFLVFLDSQGNPSDSIHEGLWYLATEKDIVEKTKQQFLADRREYS